MALPQLQADIANMLAPAAHGPITYGAITQTTTTQSQHPSGSIRRSDSMDYSDVRQCSPPRPKPGRKPVKKQEQSDVSGTQTAQSDNSIPQNSSIECEKVLPQSSVADGATTQQTFLVLSPTIHAPAPDFSAIRSMTSKRMDCTTEAPVDDTFLKLTPDC